MHDIENFQQGPMYQALVELNQAMADNNMPKFELNVVGGFALMTHAIRPQTDVTDIDYVGANLSDAVKSLSDKIGLKYNLGTDWINNDLMLAGTTFEEFEFSTGKLHFEPAFDLDRIRINILDKKDLLRMKIISVDAAATAAELGGDFSRMKDFPDILNLMADLDLSYTDLETDASLFGGNNITNPSLIGENTITYIKTYEQEKEQGVKRMLFETSQKHIIETVRYADES